MPVRPLTALLPILYIINSMSLYGTQRSYVPREGMNVLTKKIPHCRTGLWTTHPQSPSAIDTEEHGNTRRLTTCVNESCLTTTIRKMRSKDCCRMIHDINSRMPDGKLFRTKSCNRLVVLRNPEPLCSYSINVVVFFPWVVLEPHHRKTPSKIAHFNTYQPRLCESRWSMRSKNLLAAGLGNTVGQRELEFRCKKLFDIRASDVLRLLDLDDFQDVNLSETRTMASSHVLIECLDSICPRHLAVFLVHVVGSTARVVANPNAEVLDLGWSFFGNLVQADDLAICFLDFAKLREEVPKS